MNIRKNIPVVLDNLIWFLLLFTIILFSALTPGLFLTTRNLLNILLHASVLGLMVIGQAFTMFTGNFDLSSESILAVCALAGGWLVAPKGEPSFGSGLLLGNWWWLAAIILLAVGLLLGWINGNLITRLKINNFVVTLSMLIILRGIVLAFTEGVTITKLSDGFIALGRDSNTIGPIQISIIALIVAFVIAHIVMRYRRFGRDLYAVGGNREAARAAGIDTDKRIRQAYLLSGIMAAFAGWIMAGRLGVILPRMGQGMIFEVQAAGVIGGISLFGGRGNLIGAFGGVLLLSTIDSGLKLMRVSAFWIEAIRGLIILFAMFVDAQKVRYTAVSSSAVVMAEAGAAAD
jgi:ribose/xylose/arabinose/galactoside ABC-type transport system permease subunit